MVCYIQRLWFVDSVTIALQDLVNFLRDAVSPGYVDKSLPTHPTVGQTGSLVVVKISVLRITNVKNFITHSYLHRCCEQVACAGNGNYQKPRDVVE